MTAEPMTTGNHRVPVCDADELAEGDGRVLELDGRRIAVFKAQDGIYAIDDRCSHQDAWLSDGWVEGCQVECPLHSSLFDLRTGEPSGPPATVPVRTYPVEIVDGVIHLDLSVREVRNGS